MKIMFRYHLKILTNQIYMFRLHKKWLIECNLYMMNNKDKTKQKNKMNYLCNNNKSNNKIIIYNSLKMIIEIYLI